MNLLVQVWDYTDNKFVRRRTHFEIPSLNGNDLESSMRYCEVRHVTGILFDIDTIVGNEWYYIKGNLSSKERFEEVVYGY